MSATSATATTATAHSPDVSFVSGLDLDADGRALLPLDLDNDGDLDLILRNRSGRRLRAFRNDAPAGRLLSVELHGSESNRDGVGARVAVKTDRREMIREVVSASGYLSQRSRVAQFGVGNGEKVEELTVTWPAGAEQRFTDVRSQGEIRVGEGDPGWSEVRREVWEGLRTSEPAGVLASGHGAWLEEPIPAPPARPGRGRRTLEPRAATRIQDAGELLGDVVPALPQGAGRLARPFRAVEEAGLGVAAISVDDPAERAKVLQFAEQQRLPFPVLFADDAAVNAYTVLNERLFDRRRSLAIPTSFLIDEQGRVIKVYRGETDAKAILTDGTRRLGPRRSVRGPLGALGRASRFRRAGHQPYAERSLIEPAGAMFQHALARGVATPELFNNLAGLQIAEEDYRAAAESLRRSLELASSQPNAKINLASALIELGDARRSRRAARRSPRRTARRSAGPGLARGHSGGSRRCRQRGETLPPRHRSRSGTRRAPRKPRRTPGWSRTLSGSDRRLRAGAEPGRDSALLHSNLGVLYMQRGMPANALVSFRRAVAADPGDYGANLNLALYYLQAGDDVGARQWAEKAREIDPQRPEAPQILEQLQ